MVTVVAAAAGAAGAAVRAVATRHSTASSAARWRAADISQSNQRRDHCWLAPPLQVHSSTATPSTLPAAVSPPVTSRHRPDCTPVTVPSGFSRHCWFGPPLQVHSSTLVPGAVWLPKASTYWVPPKTRSSPAAVGVQRWFAPLLQSQISTLVPGAVWLSKTSRHRPDEAPRSSVVPPTLLPVPAASRYITTPCPRTVAPIVPVGVL